MTRHRPAMINNVRAALRVAVNVAKTRRHAVDNVVLNSIVLTVSYTNMHSDLFISFII